MRIITRIPIISLNTYKAPTMYLHTQGHSSEGSDQTARCRLSCGLLTNKRDSDEDCGDNKNRVIEQGDGGGGDTGKDLSEEVTFDLRP